MQTLESLRRQLDAARDLGSVVTTMKTLAAVSIQQYERAVEALEAYNRTIEMGFRIALRQQSHIGLPESAGKAAAIVFGSDQGMCGRFNEEMAAFVSATANENQDGRWEMILAVGARGQGRLLDAGWAVNRSYGVPASVSDITNLVQEMLLEIERLRSEAEMARLAVFYNRRTSAASFEPCQLQLLPMDAQRLRRWREEPWKSRSLPAFATPRRRLLSRLVHHYLFVSLFRACAESLASENASRIAAMQAAEKSIQERLDELQGSFNQLRQAAITEELLEVVTGFEALKGSSKATA